MESGSRGLGSCWYWLRLVGDWHELEGGDNHVMCRSNKGIIFIADDCLKFVRMAGRKDDDIQLTVTCTIAHKMVISVV